MPPGTGKRFVKREDLDAGSANNFSPQGGGGTTAAPTCRIGVNLTDEKRFNRQGKAKDANGFKVNIVNVFLSIRLNWRLLLFLGG